MAADVAAQAAADAAAQAADAAAKAAVDPAAVAQVVPAADAVVARVDPAGQGGQRGPPPSVRLRRPSRRHRPHPQQPPRPPKPRSRGEDRCLARSAPSTASTTAAAWPATRAAARRVEFGEFGLKTIERGWITNRQIEAARIAMTRHIKRGGKVWITIFPDKPTTKKPAETRMGSGKGSPDGWVAVVKPGRVMFEMAGVSEELAREAMQLAGAKLPVKTKFVVRDGQEF